MGGSDDGRDGGEKSHTEIADIDVDELGNVCDCLQYRAKVHRVLGNFKEALDDLHLAVSLGEASIHSILDPVLKQQRTNSFHKKKAYLYWEMSECAGDINDHDMAIVHLTNAIEHSRESPSLLYSRGIREFKKKNYIQCIADMEAALQLFEMHLKQDLKNKEKYEVFRQLRRKGDYTYSDWNDVPVDLSPEEVDIRMRSYRQRRAEEGMPKTVGGKKNLLEVTDLRGLLGLRIEVDCWFYMGIAHYFRYTKLSPQVAPPQREAVLAPSMEAYSRAYELYPKGCKAIHERAKLHQHAGMHSAAIADFSVVIERQPRNSFAMFRRGLSFRVLQDYERAADDFEGARRQSPEIAAFKIHYGEMEGLTSIEVRPPGLEDD